MRRCAPFTMSPEFSVNIPSCSLCEEIYQWCYIYIVFDLRSKTKSFPSDSYEYSKQNKNTTNKSRQMHTSMRHCDNPHWINEMKKLNRLDSGRARAPSRMGDSACDAGRTWTEISICCGHFDEWTLTNQYNYQRIQYIIQLELWREICCAVVARIPIRSERSFHFRF